MHAVILAGGEGRRLQPHTDSLPKALVPVGGEPVVAIVLKLLAKAGVRTVGMAVNHRAEQIVTALGDGSSFGLLLKYWHESTPLSTIGPLTLIENLPETFLVLNADVLTNLPFHSLYDKHRANGVELTVATTTRIEQTDFGVMTSDARDEIVSFQEKPHQSLMVSMGVYAMNRSLLDRLVRGARFGFDDLMNRMLREKRTIRSFPWSGYWLDIGRPDDYQRACQDAEIYKSWLES